MSVINQAILNRYRRPKDIDRGLVLHSPLQCGLTARKGTIAPTFARNSTATYINPGDGLLKTAAINEPRLETNGLLMEPQSQNVLEQSEDWNAGNNWSINRNVIIAPNGLQTADTITFTASPANVTKKFTVTVNPGDKYTFSVWLKGTPGEIIKIGITRIAGTYEFSETEVTLTASWQRYSVTHTFAYSQTGVVPYCAKYGTVTFDIWGAQLEVGSVATSYIPTTSSPVTRYADTLSYAMSDSLKSIFSVDQGWTTSLEDETDMGLPGNDASNYTNGSAKFDITGQNLSAFGDSQYCIIARDASNRLAWGWCKAASGTGFTVVNSPGGTTQNWIKEASFSGSATSFDIIPASQIRSEGTVIFEGFIPFDTTPIASGSYGFPNVFVTSPASDGLIRLCKPSTVMAFEAFDGTLYTTSSQATTTGNIQNKHFFAALRFSHASALKQAVGKVDGESLIVSSNNITYDGNFGPTGLYIYRSISFPSHVKNLRIFNRWLDDASILRLANG